MERVDAAADVYEAAEARYLAGIREDVDRATLADRASALASAAKEYNRLAYRAFHAAEGPEKEQLDLLTERTEVLDELWADVAAAYREQGS